MGRDFPYVHNRPQAKQLGSMAPNGTICAQQLAQWHHKEVSILPSDGL